MRTKRKFVRVFYGAPVENVTETKLLTRLVGDLEREGVNAIVMANFFAGSNKLQIDLMVATALTACVVEVKGYYYPVKGQLNGAWSQDMGDGITRFLGSKNPYIQACDARFAVLDELRSLLAQSSESLRNSVLGMACLFPSPPKGSMIPAGNYKSTIDDYEGLMTLCRQSTTHPVSLNVWERLAQALGLSSDIGATNGKDDDIISRYLTEIPEAYNFGYAKFIEPNIDGLAPEKTTEQLLKRLLQGEQVQLIGPSGVGKTALLDRLVKVTASAGLVPIVIEARTFTDRLRPLLENAISTGTRCGLSAFLRAIQSRGSSIVLLVDGLNECNDQLRARLLRSLLAARLRYDIQLVLTSQQETPLPVPLQGATVRMNRPDLDHLRQIVESHLGRPLVLEEVAFLDVASSAQDAVVLAAVLRDCGHIDGRYVLYSTFVRRRLGEKPSSTGIHLALAKLATFMRERFLFQLPSSIARRAMQSLDGQSLGEPLLDLALSCGLLVNLGTSVRFRHDLIADYFAAEHLLLRYPAAADVAKALSRPINAELHEFTVGGCASTADVEVQLGAVPTAELLQACLKGRCGAKARSLVLDRLMDVLRRLKAEFCSVRFAACEESEPEKRSSLTVQLEDSAALPNEDRPYLMLLPYAIAEGILAPILDAMGEIDEHLEREAARLRRETHVGWRIRTYTNIYGLPLSYNGHELRELIQGFQGFWQRSSDAKTVNEIERYLAAGVSYTPGQLFILLAAYLAYSPYEHPPLPEFTEFVTTLWATGIYHLRLMTIDAVRRFAPFATDTDRERLGVLVESWLSNDNPLLNSVIFEALDATGHLNPGVEVEDLVNEYELVLQAEPTVEASQWAMSLCVCLFDHPYSSMYWEAYNEHLSASQRQDLHILALQSPPLDSMFTPWIVAALIKAPTMKAAPTLLRLATPPATNSTMPQSSVELFANVVAALSMIDVAPQFDEKMCSEGDLPWLRVTPLIQLFCRIERGEAVSQKDLNRTWQRFEDCGIAQALDVVMSLCNSMASGRERWHRLFAKRCADGIRRICSATLASNYSAAGVTSRGFWRTSIEAEHRSFAIEALATVGRRTDLAKLAPWLEDPRHGSRALRAAREIEGRE